MNEASVPAGPRMDNEPDKPSTGGLTAKLDGFQRRHPQAGFPLAVLYKYFDDSGGTWRR